MKTMNLLSYLCSINQKYKAKIRVKMGKKVEEIWEISISKLVNGIYKFKNSKNKNEAVKDKEPSSSKI